MMNKLALFVLLTLVISMTAGTKLKTRLGTGLDLAATLALLEGDVVGATGPGSSTSPNQMFLSKTDAFALFEDINNAEITLRKFYHATLDKDKYANITCPVKPDEHYCGGEFKGSRKNLFTEPIFNSDFGVVVASKPNTEVKAYIDYAKQVTTECADPVGGNWNTHMTSGYIEQDTGFHVVSYGSNSNNTRSWKITMFDQNGSSGCLNVWETVISKMTDMSTGATILLGSANSHAVYRTICWDEKGGCSKDINIQATGNNVVNEVEMKYTDLYNANEREIGRDGSCSVYSKNGMKKFTIKINPYTGKGEYIENNYQTLKFFTLSIDKFRVNEIPPEYSQRDIAIANS